MSHNLKSEIQLFFQCRSLKNKDTFSKSDPVVLMSQYNKNNNTWVQFGKTEQIKDNLNPNFITSIKIDYKFEEVQKIKFEVVDVDDQQKLTGDYLGGVETTVSKIVGSPSSTLVLKLKEKENQKENGGKIIIRAEQLEKSPDNVSMIWQGLSLKNNKCFLCSIQSFIRFYRTHETNPKQIVYETEVNKQTNPVFKQIEINLGKLASGSRDQQVICELWDYDSSGTHTFLGDFKFSIADIMEQNKKIFTFRNDRTNATFGDFQCTYINIQKKYDHFDYIKAGTEIAYVIATDFTGSNGDPTQRDSLHYLGNPKNPYREAMQAIAEILLDYDDDKMVPMYGFGAIPRFPHFTTKDVLHCFPMTGYIEKPEVFDIQGIMNCYDQCVQNVGLYGPTLFAPIIQEMMKIAQESHQNPNTDVYYVFKIMTDGVIHDMAETKKLIVDCADLPLSIIIIGIGNAEFDQMEELDGDSGLIDQHGRKAKRDLVQFVPFNKFRGNRELLSQQVLGELPHQLVQYMKSQEKYPGWCKQQLINRQQKMMVRQPTSFNQSLYNQNQLQNNMGTINQQQLLPPQQQTQPIGINDIQLQQQPQYNYPQEDQNNNVQQQQPQFIPNQP